ncbi:MAG: response regulator [Pirellulaceae bacterium]|nr:response regulator [Pirellulaceae bacterium]
MSSSKNILLVDDNEILRERLSIAIRARGHFVQTAGNYEEAVLVITNSRPEYAIIDLKMPGKSGMELLLTIRDSAPEIKVVVLTGFGNITNAVEAMRLGATNYITKPADADQVLAAFSPREETKEELTAEFHPPTLAQSEWEHMHSVLGQCNGNLTHAAEKLGISRRTLQRKLKKH